MHGASSVTGDPRTGTASPETAGEATTAAAAEGNGPRALQLHQLRYRCLRRAGFFGSKTFGLQRLSSAGGGSGVAATTRTIGRSRSELLNGAAPPTVAAAVGAAAAAARARLRGGAGSGAGTGPAIAAALSFQRLALLASEQEAAAVDAMAATAAALAEAQVEAEADAETEAEAELGAGTATVSVDEAKTNARNSRAEGNGEIGALVDDFARAVVVDLTSTQQLLSPPPPPPPIAMAAKTAPMAATATAGASPAHSAGAHRLAGLFAAATARAVAAVRSRLLQTLDSSRGALGVTTLEADEEEVCCVLLTVRVG